MPEYDSFAPFYDLTHQQSDDVPFYLELALSFAIEN